MPRWIRAGRSHGCRCRHKRDPPAPKQGKSRARKRRDLHCPFPLPGSRQPSAPPLSMYSFPYLSFPLFRSPPPPHVTCSPPHNHHGSQTSPFQLGWDSSIPEVTRLEVQWAICCAGDVLYGQELACWFLDGQQHRDAAAYAVALAQPSTESVACVSGIWYGRSIEHGDWGGMATEGRNERIMEANGTRGRRHEEEVHGLFSPPSILSPLPLPRTPGDRSVAGPTSSAQTGQAGRRWSR